MQRFNEKGASLGFCITLALLAAILICALTDSCGRTRSSAVIDGSLTVGAPLAAPGQGRASTAPTIPLADLLKQIDAHPAPVGVDAARFAALKTELKPPLIARASGSKTISIAPTGTMNAVTDLAAVSNAGGTQATLTWTEKLSGDYNSDGEVNIGDLGPLALYYGQRTDSGPDDGHRLVVGDSDPQITIGDLQAIANNYMAHIEGYQVWRGHFNGTTTDWETTFRPNVSNPANTAFSADRTTSPPVSARPMYAYTDDITGVADKMNVRYKVTAYGDGVPGAESNEAAMPPPTYFTISGTVTLVPGALSPPTLVLWPSGVVVRAQSDGTYSFTGVQDGTYAVTPYQPTYALSPQFRTVTVAGADVPGQDFSGIKGTGLAATAWPKFRGNARNTGQSPYVGSQTGTLKWALSLPSKPLSSPVLGAANTVYLGTDGAGYSPESLFAVSGSDGSIKWAADIDYRSPLYASPAILADESLYLPGVWYFYGCSPVDGSIRWSRETQWSSGSPPAIQADGTVNALTGKYIQAFEPVSGTQVWQRTLGGDSYSCPAIASDGTLYVGCLDAKVYALNPSDGSVRWTYLTGGSVGTSVAVADDGTLYAASEDGKLYALNPADGSLKWVCAFGGPLDSSPAVGADGTIYVGSNDNNVYAVNPDGTVKWSYATGRWVQSSPAVGADGTVYVGSYDGRFYALNGADGSLKWSYQTGDTILASPAIGSDGTVYIGSYDGNLYAFGP